MSVALTLLPQLCLYAHFWDYTNSIGESVQVKVTDSFFLTAIFKPVEFPDDIRSAAVLAVIPGEMMSGCSKGWLHPRRRRAVREVSYSQQS